jgi:hypothetical protein
VAGAMTETQYDKMIGPAMPKGTRSGGTGTVAPGAREGRGEGGGAKGWRTRPKKVWYGHARTVRTGEQEAGGHHG